MAVVACAVGAAGPAFGDHNWVTRDGRKIPLQRSETELAVTLKDDGQVVGTKQAMAAGKMGALEDVPGMPRARIKLLRAADTTRARRQAVSTLANVAEVRPVYRMVGDTTPLISSGSLVVKTRRGLSEAERAKLWADYRVTVVKPMDGLRDVYVVAPANGTDDDEVNRAEALAYDARTLWAEPNFRIPTRQAQASPADTYFDLQWHLHNTGQLGGVNDADIDALEAWTVAQGQDVLFSMFDDSCDVTHEDLRGNYIGTGHDPALPSNAPGFNDPSPKSIGDFHGTAVMGLAVARANSVGVRGVSFLSRFTASRGLGNLLTNAETASAYTFARQQEVDVHINSWGFIFPVPAPSVIADALETAFLEGRDLDGAEGPQPPRGMVILFAAGNDSREVDIENELAALPTVIGVGSTNDRDELSSFSNYGINIDVLAPGDGDFAGITTTDNDDAAGYPDDGLNIGGTTIDGFPDIDPAGKYTGGFAGTSASCPVAAGVAGLVLSANPLLSAGDVMAILEHTADRVSPELADYDPATGWSLLYAHGRVNAHAAAVAAQQSTQNGGRTWPRRVAGARFAGTELRWVQNGDALEFFEPEEDDDNQQPFVPLRTTDDFLVIESDADFSFSALDFPKDAQCYDRAQLGCGGSIPLMPLPDGVRILATGCGLACGAGGQSACEAGAEQCVEFLQPSAKTFYAIYARNSLGRYSFGTYVDSDGNVRGAGQLPPGTPGVPGDGGGPTPIQVGPKVSIDPRPLAGTSPLTVTFRGNALTELEIDESRTQWIFDINDPTSPIATTRTATHTYVVPAGESKTFIARLTLFDVEGNSGFAQASIQVNGPGADSGSTGGEGDVRIVAVEPGGATEVDSGRAPFTVELHVETSGLPGELQSVVWDLGDGTVETGTLVHHTYENETSTDLRFVITATITMRTSGVTVVRSTISKRMSILPGSPVVVPPDPSLPGTGAGGPGGAATPCGVLGFAPVLVCVLGLATLRRRRGV